MKKSFLTNSFLTKNSTKRDYSKSFICQTSFASLFSTLDSFFYETILENLFSAMLDKPYYNVIIFDLSPFLECSISL